TGGQHTRRAEEVLVYDGQTRERPASTCSKLPVRRLRSSERCVTQDRDHRIQTRLVRLEPVQKAAHQLNAGKFPGAQPFRELRQVHQMSLHSITFGTKYSPAATCGALC